MLQIQIAGAEKMARMILCAGSPSLNNTVARVGSLGELTSAPTNLHRLYEREPARCLIQHSPHPPSGSTDRFGTSQRMPPRMPSNPNCVVYQCSQRQSKLSQCWLNWCSIAPGATPSRVSP